jgi:hypothetical protein
MHHAPTSQFAVPYRYAQPHSQILIAECTKEWARQQVKAGVYPARSIWIPGCCAGSDARPEIGDLFAPDDRWKGPTPLHAVSDDRMPWQRAHA